MDMYEERSALTRLHCARWQAAIKIQNVFRAKVARGEIRVRRAQNAASGGATWVEVMDPGTGMPVETRARPPQAR